MKVRLTAHTSKHGGQVAQSVEQRTENPCVECSIHSLPTNVSPGIFVTSQPLLKIANCRVRARLINRSTGEAESHVRAKCREDIMKIKVAPIGIVAALVFAFASAQPCAAMGPIGAGIGVGALGGTAPYVRASPWANDVPGEPQGQGNFWKQVAAQRAASAKTELHFDLSQCQKIDTGLYNCSATDKPICNGESK